MAAFEQKQSLVQTGDLVRPAQPERDIARPAPVTDPLVAEQQAIGNQAMLRFAESCPLTLPSASICPYGGVCDTCPAPVQTKLTINKPGDKYEQEADRIADQVVRMPEPQLQRQPICKDEECEETIQTKPLADQITPLIQRQPEEEEEEEEFLQSKPLDGWPAIYGGIESQFIQRQPEEEEEKEEEEILQTKRESGITPEVNPGIEAGINSLNGRGRPLDRETRAFMEPRFGYDFSDVRIHADSNAANIARSVNSRAFTVGKDVVFGTGQYQPGTDQGHQLLAHELTHVIQQRRNGHIRRNMLQRATNIKADFRHVDPRNGKPAEPWGQSFYAFYGPRITAYALIDAFSDSEEELKEWDVGLLQDMTTHWYRSYWRRDNTDGRGKYVEKRFKTVNKQFRDRSGLATDVWMRDADHVSLAGLPIKQSHDGMFYARKMMLAHDSPEDIERLSASDLPGMDKSDGIRNLRIIRLGCRFDMYISARKKGNSEWRHLRRLNWNYQHSLNFEGMDQSFRFKSENLKYGEHGPYAAGKKKPLLSGTTANEAVNDDSYYHFDRVDGWS